eukprot:365170-Chlamydomonas_euryale.AAC.3
MHGMAWQARRGPHRMHGMTWRRRCVPAGVVCQTECMRRHGISCHMAWNANATWHVKEGRRWES